MSVQTIKQNEKVLNVNVDIVDDDNSKQDAKQDAKISPKVVFELSRHNQDGKTDMVYFKTDPIDLEWKTDKIERLLQTFCLGFSIKDRYVERFLALCKSDFTTPIPIIVPLKYQGSTHWQFIIRRF